MTIRQILEYPNPILRQKALPITPEDIETDRIQTLINDMIETMYHFEGTVGLAAPQVGESVQLFVMDATAKTTRDRLFVLINPVITNQSKWKYSREGCLSFPNYLVTVKRARKLTYEALSRDGKPIEDALRDFEAIIMQHEVDHLHGTLFIDRAKNMATDVLIRGQLPSQDN